MNENPVHILFMDDEIGDPAALVIQDAISALRTAGYKVTTVDRMSAAVDAFYNTFHKVFILDVDMSKVLDELLSGRGTEVAKILKSLDNDCAVILFSARGGVHDMIAAANVHISGYVFKGAEDPVAELLQRVKAACALNPAPTIPEPPDAGCVLCSLAAPCAISAAECEAIIRSIGAFEPVHCALADMPDRLAAETFAAAIVLADSFDTRPSIVNAIQAVCAVKPHPHAVFGCASTEDARPAVQAILNAGPFRIVDLSADNPVARLAEALRSAIAWRGGNETFQAKVDYVHRAAADIDWDEISRSLDDDQGFSDGAVEPGASFFQGTAGAEERP